MAKIEEKGKVTFKEAIKDFFEDMQILKEERQELDIGGLHFY